MTGSRSIFHHLAPGDLEKILVMGRPVAFRKGDVIFAEGEEAEHLYRIESGQVSMYIERFSNREDLTVLGPGEFFGEMAVLRHHKRSASVQALTDAIILVIDKPDFLELLAEHPAIGAGINTTLAARSEELTLREALMAGCGLDGKAQNISIKGDPSLRESAFTRERYESVVDAVLEELCPRIEEMLIDRCVFDVVIHFNSGEVRVASIFNPFNPETHPANKLTESGYLDRHFPRIGYERKSAMIRRLFGTILGDECFTQAPEHVRHLYEGLYQRWEPTSPAELSTAISQIPALRRIPNFYLRNFAIGMTRDTIRMQFNCDGTHIVATRDYLRFVADNVE
ncbi:MAG: cyclic nucleotide-binding domain-containing protein [Alphaproteobacteria bacterium]